MERTPEQIKEHYEIEKQLASKLRNASKEERRFLYRALYDELYQRVPHHPQLAQKADPEARSEIASKQMKLLRHFLSPESTLMEIGPGDCCLSFEAARLVKKVYAVDVSEEITKSSRYPQNFELILSNGCSIPVPENTVNVAYSSELMEHLHPDDAHEQVGNVCKALAPGGVYICITPNRLYGPHDVSRYFDEVATGFHLREYTVTELAEIFQTIGFSKLRICISAKGFPFLLPVFPARWIEYLLAKLPYWLRRRIASWLPVRLLLGITLVATK